MEHYSPLVDIMFLLERLPRAAGDKLEESPLLLVVVLRQNLNK